MKSEITKKLVDSLDPAREVTIWDESIPGFGLRVRGRRKVYVYRYGAGVSGRSRWITIGEHEHPWRPDPAGLPRRLTAQLARREAERLRGLVVDHQDPAADRDVVRRIPTLAAFAERYQREHSEAHKAASTREGDAWFLERKILPEFGTDRLDRIDRGRITRWHVAQRERPATANRCLSLLGAIFTAAIRWGVLPGPNPCALVRAFKIDSRERLLSPDELQRIGVALSAPDPSIGEPSRTGIMLLMLTGARCSEIATLAWEQVDNAREVVVGGVVGLAISQKGKTGRRTIIFPPAAVEILRRVGAVRVGPWVLPARHGRVYGQRGHINAGTLSHAWKSICERAGVPDCHLHDLRHLFISTAVEGGRSLPHAGKLAGHSTTVMTERYTHLTQGPLLKLADQTATTIKEALDLKA